MGIETNSREETAFDRFFNYFANNGYTAVLFESPEKQAENRIMCDKIILAEKRGWKGGGRGSRKNEKIPLTDDDITYITERVAFFNEAFGGVGWISGRNSRSDNNWWDETLKDFHEERARLKKYIPKEYIN